MTENQDERKQGAGSEAAPSGRRRVWKCTACEGRARGDQSTGQHEGRVSGKHAYKTDVCVCKPQGRETGSSQQSNDCVRFSSRQLERRGGGVEGRSCRYPERAAAGPRSAGSEGQARGSAPRRLWGRGAPEETVCVCTGSRRRGYVMQGEHRKGGRSRRKRCGHGPSPSDSYDTR